jgi:hypothetical protein
MKEYTRDEIIEAARNAAAKSNGQLSRRDFIRITGISEYQINKLFPEGRWTAIKQLAGIQRHPMDRYVYSDEELLSEFHRIAEKIDRIPTWAIIDAEAKMSSKVMQKQFGGLQGTLKTYQSWLEKHYPQLSLLELIKTKSRHEIPTPPVLKKTTSEMTWDKTTGVQYGPPIDFRGLRHAPINEQGVIYLFGMISYELGFIVEALHSEYPDCEAKRHIGENRWQRVRIEFEYQSRSFRDHGHDPSMVDLIVCWEHNWSEAPVEVLELRSAINELKG